MQTPRSKRCRSMTCDHVSTPFEAKITETGQVGAVTASSRDKKMSRNIQKSGRHRGKSPNLKQKEEEKKPKSFLFTWSKHQSAPTSVRADPLKGLCLCGVQAVRGTVSCRIRSLILLKALTDNTNSCLPHCLCCVLLLKHVQGLEGRVEMNVDGCAGASVSNSPSKTKAYFLSGDCSFIVKVLNNRWCHDFSFDLQRKED